MSGAYHPSRRRRLRGLQQQTLVQLHGRRVLPRRHVRSRRPPGEVRAVRRLRRCGQARRSLVRRRRRRRVALDICGLGFRVRAGVRPGSPQPNRNLRVSPNPYPAS